MTEAEKRTPQEIADAIKETVRTLNEHIEEAAHVGLSVQVDTHTRIAMGAGKGRDIVTAECFLKL